MTDELPGIGHNHISHAGYDARLSSIVERLERLEEERRALGTEITGVYKEAGSTGYDVKVLRALIAVRRKEPAEVEEHEAMLDVYRRAVGM